MINTVFVARGGVGGTWSTNIRGCAAGKAKKLPCPGVKLPKMLPCPGVKFSYTLEFLKISFLKVPLYENLKGARYLMVML